MARMTKAEKIVEQRAERVAQNACFGFQINIMDLGKVSAKAKAAIAAGLDDSAALASVREHVATFAKAV